MHRVALGALLIASLTIASCPTAARVEPIAAPSVAPALVSAADAGAPPFEIDGGADRGRVASSHPLGRFESVLRSSREFAYGDPSRSTPTEGVLVSATLVHPGTDQMAVRYVMKREAAGYFPQGGDWRYAVFGANGELQKHGKLALCARCHAEAPRDFLFERGTAKFAR